MTVKHATLPATHVLPAIAVPADDIGVGDDGNIAAMEDSRDHSGDERACHQSHLAKADNGIAS